MKFTLTINCDNAAFDDDLQGEVVRLLHKAAEDFWSAADGNIRDINGNTVGRFELTEQ